MKNKRRMHIAFTILGIPVLAGLGFLITYGAALSQSLEGHSDLYVGLVSLLIIVVLLAVPYWTLKFLAHAAHKIDPHEKEWHLSDVAKNKQQFEQSQKTNHAA